MSPPSIPTAMPSDNNSIELNEWAAGILYGDTLEAKLSCPARWSDRERTVVAVPALPVRPHSLQIDDGRSVGLPTATALNDPSERGRLLHMFANHELLALELMAAALVRFVDAPAAFRRGLAHALAEEQLHLRLYLDRMNALGVRFGQHELGGFFWRVMASMQSPLDFVAHMSLTFEQANLDFARSYALQMRAVGDIETAQVLDRVHADEVGHVKLGLVWFERWRDRGPSLFEAHRRALRSPVTPRRARGLGFDRQGRVDAGLPDDYITQVECFEASRGRPPVVHAFEPTAELSLGLRGAFTAPKWLRTFADDLALLPAFAAERDDIVVVSDPPSVEHVAELRSLGLPLPQLLAFDELRAGAESVPPRLAELRPWGWSPHARARWATVLPQLDRPPPPPRGDAIVHSKRTWHEVRVADVEARDVQWLDEAGTLGVVAETFPDVEVAIAQCRGRGYEQVVIKAPFGTSGRNAQRIGQSPLRVQQRGWIDRIIEAQGAVLVEPWLDRMCDLSLRITVRSDELRIDDLGRFVTDRGGQYLGALLGPLARTVPSDVARWLHDDGRDPGRVERQMHRVGRLVGTVAAEHGYRGPIGIDAMIYRDLRGALRLRPLVEANVRSNFGHIGHGLARRVARGTAGLFVLIRLADLDAGLDATTAVERARAVLPVAMHGQPAKLCQGVVPLNDPARAKAVVGLLVVAKTQTETVRALASIAPRMAERLRDSGIGDRYAVTTFAGP